MIPDRIISDFKQQRLHIDLRGMSIVQNKPGNKAISYKGSGYIQQTEDDVLTFKLYANETSNIDFYSSSKFSNEVKLGTLYPDQSFYTLSGIASDGTVWKADGVLPDCDWIIQHPNPIVHGNLSSINGGKLLSDAKSLAIHFFEKADLPMMMPEAKFIAVGCEFHIVNHGDSFVVGVKSDGPLNDQMAMRVEEALRFLLAQSVTPRAIVRPSGLVLMSITLKSPKARIGPPISRGSGAFHRNSWDLFGTYLNFVYKTKFPNWNFCSGYLHIAHEASANSLDAWTAGLGVAVEGLASLINIEQDKAGKKRSKTEKERLKKLQIFIVKQVASRKRLRGFTSRVEGLVAGLTTVRAIDRLKWLVENEAANPAHVKAWQKLRNRSVHPAAQGDVDVASLDFQKTVDQLNQVTVLLYHIVFHLICYRGPYTDYATQDFPAKNYPLASTSQEYDDGPSLSVSTQ